MFRPSALRPSTPRPPASGLLLAPLCGVLAACASMPSPSPAVEDTAGAALRIDVPVITHPAGETAQWWFRAGAAQAAERGAATARAKNVILFVGDGMSLPTVAAARILEGQRRGGSGEEHRLGWEAFDGTAFSRTYNTDSQTPDSAGTMSAMATGIKTRAGVLSITQQAARWNCAQGRAAPALTLWELAEAAGLATGIVTTARLTHATPAATFAHSADRGWENDADLPAEARAQGCIDIARQMIETPYGDGPEVMMGGGRGNFLPTQQRDPEYDDKVGARLDGRDLVAEWRARRPDGAYVWNARQLANAPAEAPLLGLFDYGHMQFEHDRASDPAGEPSLAEMTRAAIARLSRNRQGYVLLVEGGRIDHAHHFGNAYRALTDTLAMSDAVRAAAAMTSPEDTLILVTADHSHTMTFAGYPRRGNPILGRVRSTDGGTGEPVEDKRDALGLPFTTLGYANGPGYPGASDQQPEGPKRFLHAIGGVQPARSRPDLSHVDTAHPDYLQESAIPLQDETHGGDDVGIWARGPGSGAVRGSLEQNALFHMMLQATPRLRETLCAKTHCEQGVPVEFPDPAAFRSR